MNNVWARLIFKDFLLKYWNSLAENFLFQLQVVLPKTCSNLPQLDLSKIFPKSCAILEQGHSQLIVSIALAQVLNIFVTTPVTQDFSLKYWRAVLRIFLLLCRQVILPKSCSNLPHIYLGKILAQDLCDFGARTLAVESINCFCLSLEQF